MDPNLKLSPLIGKTITSIEGARVDSQEVVISTAEGPRYLMNHQQDCCEYVRVTKVSDDIENKLGKVLSVREDIETSTSSYESGTQSTYTINTESGEIKIEWLGESNGYYGEGVDFYEIK